MRKQQIFKPYINTKDYQGGVTRDEVEKKNDITNIWKLSSNENMLGPSPLAITAIIDNLSDLNEYKFRDDTVLKNAICKANKYLNPYHIFTANSGVETLELIIRGFVTPGSECIISHPTFIAYEGLVVNEGGKVLNIPLLKNNYMVDVDRILASINQSTRLIFITNPNNPTGTYTPRSVIDKLIRKLPEHVVLVYDEVYFHFVDAPDYPFAFEYIKRGKNVIGVHSFSKAFGLAGIRLGYGIATQEIVSYIEQIRRPFILDTLSMVAGIAALEDHEHLTATVQLIKQEKKWLYKQLDQLNITYWRSQTNFIFMEPPIKLEEFNKILLNDGIMIRPCNMFGAPNGARITIGTREANQALVLALKKIMQKQIDYA